jgi:hypothetical protein
MIAEASRTHCLLGRSASRASHRNQSGEVGDFGQPEHSFFKNLPADHARLPAGIRVNCEEWNL